MPRKDVQDDRVFALRRCGRFGDCELGHRVLGHRVLTELRSSFMAVNGKMVY